MVLRQDKYGGFIADTVTKKLLDSLGVTQEHVDKVKSILDNINIESSDDTVTITIKIAKK